MNKPSDSPCPKCPFLRTALRGYTGEQKPERFAAVAAIGEMPLPCHCAVDYTDPDWAAKLEDVPQCAGHAIFLSNSAKSPRNPEVHTLPKSDQIFANAIEFVQYHCSTDRKSAMTIMQREVLNARYA